MHSTWLSLCQLFNVYPNVVWFNIVLRGLSATQKTRWIVRLLGIFDTLLGYELCVFHMLSAAYSIGQWIYILVLLFSYLLHVVPLLIISTNAVPNRKVMVANPRHC